MGWAPAGKCADAATAGPIPSICYDVLPESMRISPCEQEGWILELEGAEHVVWRDVLEVVDHGR